MTIQSVDPEALHRSVPGNAVGRRREDLDHRSLRHHLRHQDRLARRTRIAMPSGLGQAWVVLLDRATALRRRVC